MRQLLLLRHAKAMRAGPDDHRRALEERGIEDSTHMGRYLRDSGIVPALILSSDSTRTRQTIGHLLPQLGALPPVVYRADLYLAEALAIVAIIRSAPDGATPLMIVGHNPGIEQCALLLAPRDTKKRRRYDAMEEKFPTCALAVIAFDAERWRDINLGTLEDFVRPKDLDGR